MKASCNTRFAARILIELCIRAITPQEEFMNFSSDNHQVRACSLLAGLATIAMGLRFAQAQAPSPPPNANGVGPPRENTRVLVAKSLPDIAPLVHFEAVNRNEPEGDRLGPARRLAATIVAQDKPSPNLIVDVGSFTGEFLEAFMEQFPESHGQWTEPVETNHENAKKRLGRFGDHVTYVIGCASRDISLGCVPKGVDTLITSWLSIHQNLPGIQKFYRDAAAMLPSGGWVANLDHVKADSPGWGPALQNARALASGEGLVAVTEGPPVHHKDYVTPTLEQQLAALRDAGFEDPQVIWRRLDTVLLMARKK